MNLLKESTLNSQRSKQRIIAPMGNALAAISVFLISFVPSYSQSKAQKKEFAALSQRATAGDANSQLELGVDYLLDRGVPIQDSVQAHDWLVKSADQGNAMAQFWLGEMYSTGWGIPEDKAQAAGWYRKAANQGLATAQYDLGIMYDSGRGVQLNHPEAVKWIQKAANQDYVPAKLWLQKTGVDTSSASASSATKTRPAQDNSVPTIDLPESAAQIDIRYFLGDSRTVTEVEMHEIRNSLHWDPKSVPLTPGGTARSDLIDANGHKMGSVLVRWDKTSTQEANKSSTHPNQWHGYFSIQIENGTSCRFTSSAELDDSQGFVVVTSPTWNGWMMQHQPEAGQTSQTQGDAAWTQNVSSLALKPLTAYSTLTGCTTPQN